MCQAKEQQSECNESEGLQSGASVKQGSGKGSDPPEQVQALRCELVLERGEQSDGIQGPAQALSPCQELRSQANAHY